MQKVYGKGITGWGQLAILIGLIGAGILVATIITVPVWKVMTNGSLFDIEKDMFKPENADAAKVLQIISAIVMMFIPTIGYAFISYRNGWTFLGFKEQLNAKHLLIVLLLIVCSIPLMSALEELNKIIPISAALRVKFDAMEKEYNDQIMMLVKVNDWKQYLISLFIIALLPAVTEEVVFRGGFQNLFTHWWKSPIVAIIVTSLIFSAIHMSWYGFFVRFFLGMILGAIFYLTKNIWLNILLHFINNALVVTSLYITGRSGKPVDMTSEQDMPLWTGAIGLVLVIVLIRWLIKTAATGPIFNERDENYIDPRNPFGDSNRQLN